MICFTASNKFKNMHPGISDQECGAAAFRRFALGLNPVAELSFMERPWEWVEKWLLPEL